MTVRQSPIGAVLSRATPTKATTHQRIILVLLAFLLGLSGCSTQTVTPTQSSVAATANKPYSVAQWGLTLRHVVVGSEVDYAAILENRSSLDEFLALLAQHGPRKTPDAFVTRDARLAYWINASNAATLWCVTALAKDGMLPAQLPRDLDTRFRFDMDGRLQTPNDLRHQALLEAGDDWRVRFAMCDGTRDGPPLADRPLLPEMLNAQLDRLVARALASPQVLTIDHAEPALLVWSGLHDLQSELVAQHRTITSTPEAGLVSFLLTRCDPEQRVVLNTAVGYPVRSLPVIRAVNAVPADMSDGSSSPFAGFQLPKFNWPSPK